MNFFLTSNKKYILKFYIYELSWLKLKYIISDINLNLYLKYFIFLKLIKNKNMSFIKIHKRCYLTNRSHSIYRFMKLSRILLKDLSLDGSLIGFKKASW